MIPLPLLSLGLKLLANWQKYLIIGLVILAAAGVVWMHGYGKGSSRLFEYKAEQAEAKVVIIQKIVKLAGEVRERWHAAETRYVTEYVEIEKESADVPVRPACNATAGWVRSHNAAAAADSSSIGNVADATDTGITEAQALATVRGNYKSYHQVANDLKACRGFVHGLPRATE
jgi:hypothetical protein